MLFWIVLCEHYVTWIICCRCCFSIIIIVMFLQLLNICLKGSGDSLHFRRSCMLAALWQNRLADRRESASKNISNFWIISAWRQVKSDAADYSHLKQQNKNKETAVVYFPPRLPRRFLWLSVCWGVSLSEWSWLWPHHRTVLLQDGLHRTELRAQWVCFVVFMCGLLHMLDFKVY